MLTTQEFADAANLTRQGVVYLIEEKRVKAVKKRRPGGYYWHIPAAELSRFKRLRRSGKVGKYAVRMGKR